VIVWPSTEGSHPGHEKLYRKDQRKDKRLAPVSTCYRRMKRLWTDCRASAEEIQGERRKETNPFDCFVAEKARAARRIDSAGRARRQASCFFAPSLVAAESVQLTEAAKASLRVCDQR
jgi:hypothetical protein